MGVYPIFRRDIPTFLCWLWRFTSRVKIRMLLDVNEGISRVFEDRMQKTMTPDLFCTSLWRRSFSMEIAVADTTEFCDWSKLTSFCSQHVFHMDTWSRSSVFKRWKIAKSGCPHPLPVTWYVFLQPNPVATEFFPLGRWQTIRSASPQSQLCLFQAPVIFELTRSRSSSNWICPKMCDLLQNPDVDLPWGIANILQNTECAEWITK